jgi:hypothetical protein
MRSTLRWLLVALVLAGLAALGWLTAGPAYGTTSVVATPSSPHSWSFAETRATGHYAFASTGLHVWTEGTTSTDKVAGYVPVTGVTLANVADGPAPSLDYDAVLPTLPGLQVVIDAGDGVPRILVGETVYGDKWWMPNSFCGTWCDGLTVPWSAGGGSAHSATLAQWSTGVPGAVVTAFGFSLGSGAYGDGTIRSLSLEDVCYGFDVDAPVTTTVPSSSSSSSTTSTSTSSTSTSTTSGSSSQATTTTGSSSYVWPTTTSHRAAPVYASDDDDDDLAYTGASDVRRWVLIGGGLVLIGGGLVTILALTRGRRRRDNEG